MSTAPCVVILTVSDRCSRGETVDTSGPTLQALATQHLGATIAHAECLPDDMAALAQFFAHWSEETRHID
ncbi:MAG: molybdopterin-binding protein, partial [Planctomycetota bacterium]